MKCPKCEEYMERVGDVWYCVCGYSMSEKCPYPLIFIGVVAIAALVYFLR